MVNPSLLLCSDDGISLCQPCYSSHYNCTTHGHRIQIVNRFPLHYNQNNNTYQHHGLAHVPHVVQHHGNNNNQQQRRAGMFEMSCNGDNNNCERWMFAMRCESCLASDAVVYCRGHDKLMCHNCDQMLHLQEAVPPHLRCKLCGNCKRPSNSFLIGADGHHFTYPPAPIVLPPPAPIHPPPAEVVSAALSTGLSLHNYDSDLFDDDFSWFGM
ncbi:zinc finger protein HD1 [Capsella rubella]|nr:zinc finger protein HD1 [Capsella rubella]